MEIPKTKITIILVGIVIILSIGFIVKDFFQLNSGKGSTSGTTPAVTEGQSAPVLSPVGRGIYEGTAGEQDVKVYNESEVEWETYYYDNPDGKRITIQVPIGETPPPGAYFKDSDDE